MKYLVRLIFVLFAVIPILIGVIVRFTICSIRVGMKLVDDFIEWL